MAIDLDVPTGGARMALADDVTAVRRMEEGDGGVALGYPLIQGRDGRPAAVGYPLAEEPQPSIPRRPETDGSCCTPDCKMFMQAFMIVVGFVLVTEFFLCVIFQSPPSPVTLLIFLPIVFLVFAASAVGCLAMIACCDDNQKKVGCKIPG